MWQFETILENFDNSKLWGGHVVVDDTVVDEIKKSKIKRLVCTINSQEKFHCALQSAGNGTYFVMVNKALQKKLRAPMGTKLSVSLEEDKSKYGMPMPEEMAEVLAQDSEIDSLFHSLTAGKQRSLLYIIGKPKTAESRIKKAVLITRYLAEVSGNIDFREMNEYI
ncbi:MAG: DUF1905 domain-containing protein, partial [Flavobacteriales bacterium]